MSSVKGFRRARLILHPGPVLISSSVNMLELSPCFIATKEGRDLERVVCVVKAASLLWETVLQIAPVDSLERWCDHLYHSIQAFPGNLKVNVKMGIESTGSFLIIDLCMSKLDQLEVKIKNLCRVKDLSKMQPIDYCVFVTSADISSELYT